MTPADTPSATPTPVTIRIPVQVIVSLGQYQKIAINNCKMCLTVSKNAENNQSLHRFQMHVNTLFCQANDVDDDISDK